MDIELEQNDNKKHFSEDNARVPDSKNKEKMNRLDINKISSKEKTDRITNRLNKTLKNYKNTKN